MKNTFRPEVTWQELRGEVMHNGRTVYFPPVEQGQPVPAVVLIKGSGNGQSLAYSGQTENVLKYFRSGSSVLKKIKSIEAKCGECQVFVALETDVTNDNQSLPTGFFTYDHVRKAIAEVTNVEHQLDGYTIIKSTTTN